VKYQNALNVNNEKLETIHRTVFVYYGYRSICSLGIIRNFKQVNMGKTTQEHGEILTDIMILTEVWLSKWQELIDTGYNPKMEFKAKGTQFKRSLEGLQAQLFNGAKQSLTEAEYKEFERTYMGKVSEVEILLKEYLAGKVTVIES